MVITRSSAPSNSTIRVGIIDGHHDLIPLALTCLGRVPGIEPFVLSKAPRPRARYSRYTAGFTARPWEMAEGDVLDCIGSFVKANRIDVLLPCVEAGLGFCCRHQAALRKMAHLPPLPSLATLDLVGDKYRLACHLHERGLSALDAVTLDGSDDAARRLAALREPFVVKPRRGSRGVGIRVFDTLDALLTYCKQHPRDAASRFAQSLIGGQQWSCSAICRDGEIVAATTYRGLVNQKLSHSLGMRYCHDERVEGFVAEVLGGLRWSGIANIELRLGPTTGRIELLDFNPRIFRSTLGSLTAGVNLPLCAVRAALGEHVEPTAFREGDFFLCKAFRKRPLALIGQYLRSSGRRLPRQEWYYALRDLRPSIAARLLRGRLADKRPDDSAHHGHHGHQAHAA